MKTILRWRQPLFMLSVLASSAALLTGCPDIPGLDGPRANFQAVTVSGAAPLLVQFNDTTLPGAAQVQSWQWAFGDGATSTDQHPSHLYQNAGVYSVSLTVFSPAGSDNLTRNSYINVTNGGGGAEEPTANFSATPRSGEAPLPVSFTDSSQANGSTIASWFWNFGDGTSSTQRHPQHSYTQTGIYTVSLTVSSAGGTDMLSQSGYIVVSDSPGNLLPEAAFTAVPRSGIAPLPVQFTDQSSGNGVAITAWLWSFGDGSTSTQQNPAHTYNQAGNFNVTLKVSSANGSDTETKPSFVTVSDGTGNQAEYDRGFEEGYAEDPEYWQGYADSWDTRDGGPIYYTGSEIPYYDEVSYRAGYWDGVWYAYNDGYFVAYDYAFTIGFSEGYDLAFYPDWYEFLSQDQHVEWLDGGFSDGYNDGFSEGRILGATDYAKGLPYDWLDALLWYREGNDAYIEELDLGTGAYGPVDLYEYGVDPHDLVKSTLNRKRGAVTPGGMQRSIRVVATTEKATGKAEEPALSYRPLIAEVKDELDVNPEASPRSTTPLQLDSTWLQRINAYLEAYAKGQKSASERGAKLAPSMN